MKHISILVPRGAAALGCIEGSFIVFNRANELLAAQGKAPLFQVKLVGLTREAQVYDKLFAVTPDLDLEGARRTDLIIIPAVNGDMDKVVALNRDFLPWIINHYKNGSEVASLCVGAFLLASTGLLKGKSCATHWLAAHDFRKKFPDVKLVSDKVITDEQGIYSSGGASSFMHLLLHIIEKHAGREMAILLSKYFSIDIDRVSQSSFILFQGQKDHRDDAVKSAQEFIEGHFQDRITVDQLSSRFAVGRRSLERRFKKATSSTVSDYIQRVKIEAAKKGLESSRKNINEVMFAVGYTDPKAFRTVFKKLTGLSPIDYRNKYNKEAWAA